MLNTKQYDLICFLHHNDTYVIADTLARQLDISTRTVQRYVDIINDELISANIQIQSTRGTGYQLLGNEQVIRNWLNENREHIENDVERLQVMVRYILDSDYLTIDQLSEKMNYSNSTITKLTTELKEMLKKYDLQLVSKPYYGLHIEGKEVNIRTLLSDCGFQVHNNQLKVKIRNITQDEFQQMDEIILSYLNKNNIVIADRDINDLLARVVISISRCKQLHYVENLPMQKNVRHHNFDVIYGILNQIAQNLAIELRDDEYNYVSIYSGFIIYNFNPEKLSVEHNIHTFVLKALEEISMVSGIHFREQEHIINSLSAHLNILLNRINTKETLKNPLLQQIKSNYAMEMNYAIFLAKKLEETYNVQVSEDELGYLAMYFGAARTKQNHYKRVVILCNYGVGTAQLIGERIKQEFRELEVVGIYPIHYLELAIAQDIDLIVSTIQIENYHGEKPLIVVDNLLAIDSLTKIKEALYDKDSDVEKLASNFKQEAWFHINASSRSEAIAQLGHNMMNNHDINPEILASICERETISSTDIGNLVAIPHTIFTQDLPSVIGVGILDKPILWDKERVQLIFMICFNKEDKTNGSAFRHLYKAVKNISTVHKLIDSYNYSEFMKWLKGENK